MDFASFLKQYFETIGLLYSISWWWAGPIVLFYLFQNSVDEIFFQSISQYAQVGYAGNQAAAQHRTQSADDGTGFRGFARCLVNSRTISISMSEDSGNRRL